MRAAVTLRTPKTADGRVEAIRLLSVARRSAMKARTQAANQIHAVVTTAPAELRSDLAGLCTKRLVARCARFHTTPATTPLGAARRTLRLLARRWQSPTDEIKNSTSILAARPAAGVTAAADTRIRGG